MELQSEDEFPSKLGNSWGPSDKGDQVGWFMKVECFLDEQAVTWLEESRIFYECSDGYKTGSVTPNVGGVSDKTQQPRNRVN